MSLASPYSEVYQVADGATTVFAFGQAFTPISKNYVKCIVYFQDGTSSVPEFVVNLEQGSISVVTLTTPQGELLNVIPAGAIVRIFRDVPESQDVTASQLQNYTAKQLEKSFDDIVAMIQEVSFSDQHKTLRLTETQRDVFLQKLGEAEDKAILMWDNEKRSLVASRFTEEAIEAAIDYAVQTAEEAKVISKEALSGVQSAVEAAERATTAAEAAEEAVRTYDGRITEAQNNASQALSQVRNKQDKLVSGTNIKTINSQSVLGSGNIAVQSTLVSGTNIKTINGQSVLGAGNITVGGAVNSVNGKTGTVVLTGEDIIAEVNTEADTVQGHLQTNSDEIDAVKEKVKEIELSKFPNATIIGEPTIQQGQVSGFSTMSYLQFPFILDLHEKAFQIDMCFTTATNVQTQQNILDSRFGIALAIQNGKGVMAISSNGTNWNIGSTTGTMTLQSNTTYYARLTWDRLQYKTFLSTDGVNYIQDMVLVGAIRPFPTTIYIGGCDQVETGHTPHPFLGTINLNKASLSVMGNVIWQGMDDAGLATRADISLDNLDAAGQAKFDAKQNKLIAGENITIDETTNTISATGGGTTAKANLFDYKFTDHILNDMSWVKANDYSWLSSSVYQHAYEHLMYDKIHTKLSFSLAAQNTNLTGHDWTAISYIDATLSLTVPRYCAISDGGYVSYSSDGITWSAPTQALSNKLWTGLASTGASVYAITDGAVAHTVNGTFYEETAVPELSVPGGTLYWYAIANKGSGTVAISSTGYVSRTVGGGISNWTQATQDANLGSNGWMALAYTGTKYVALGANGHVSTSVDGTTWTPAQQITNLGANSWRSLVVAENGNKLIALSQTGYVSYSYDEGLTWTAADYQSFLGNNTWEGIATNGTDYVCLGIAGHVSQGSIFKQETIADTTIRFIRSSADGHKIVLADQATAVQSIYNATGIAWYYILDEENKQFKVPRTKYNFVGSSGDTAGDYVAPGLPNITGLISAVNPGLGDYKFRFTAGSGALKGTGTASTGRGPTTGETGTGYPNASLDASWSNSIYGNSTTVQAPATEMQLYFYVGEFTQTAIENTAGLNTELFNGKADVDLTNAVANASATAKTAIIGWGMPDYTSGVAFSNNTNYTAPSDGFVIASGWTSTSTNSDFYLNGTRMATFVASTGAWLPALVYCPVHKGDVIKINFTQGTYTRNFYPLKGV